MELQNSNKYQHQPKSREYLIALTNFPNYCELLNPKGQRYEKLLTWIINYGKDLQTDPDKILPDLKVISKITGVSYSAIGKQLKNIYTDIYDLSDTNPNHFTEKNQKTFALGFNYLGCYGFFNLGLDEIPREGERFNFSFIKPKVGSDRFWVKTIEHDMVNGKHAITIWLSHENPNIYLRLLKEKAYLNRDIGLHEYYDHLSYDTEQKLINLYRNL